MGNLIVLETLYVSIFPKPAVTAVLRFPPVAASHIEVFIVVACRHHGVARRRKVVAKANALSVKV